MSSSSIEFFICFSEKKFENEKNDKKTLSRIKRDEAPRRPRTVVEKIFYKHKLILRAQKYNKNFIKILFCVYLVLQFLELKQNFLYLCSRYFSNRCR